MIKTGTISHKHPRVRNARRRDRAQRTNRSGDPRVEHVAAPTPRVPRRPRSYPVGPVGRFARAARRMDNYVAHGEWLERELSRAKTPADRERIQRALLAQIRKVERYAYVVSR